MMIYKLGNKWSGKQNKQDGAYVWEFRRKLFPSGRIGPMAGFCHRTHTRSENISPFFGGAVCSL